MVPDVWKVTRLSDLADIKRGAGSQYLTYVDSPDEGVRLIRISDFLGDSKKYILHTSAIDRFMLEKGDILIAGTGATAGIIFRVPDEYVGFPFSYNAPRIRPKNSSCSAYLYYYLCSDSIIRQQHALFTGNAQPFLDTKAIGGFKVFAPPLPEQKKIAQILSTWDQAIAATARLLDNSQQRKKGLMQQLLTGKKRLPGFQGCWKEGHLKDISSISKGKALSSKDLKEGGFPVVAGGKASPYTHYDYTHDHAITVSASGAYAGYVAYHQYKFWASDCSVVEATEASDIEFLYHLMTWNQTRIYSLQSGGAQPHVYPKDISALRVLIPPREEQRAIADVLTTATKEMEGLQVRFDLLKQEKKALTQQLLTGKRRVKLEAA